MRQFVFVATLFALAVATTLGSAHASTSHGLASFYSYTSRTASGESVSPDGMTAAHRTLPFNTRVRVTDVKTGRSVVVRINDRGPFIKGRIIDLSRGAARSLGILSRGVAAVRVDVVS